MLALCKPEIFGSQNNKDLIIKRFFSELKTLAQIEKKFYLKNKEKFVENIAVNRQNFCQRSSIESNVHI